MNKLLLSISFLLSLLLSNCALHQRPTPLSSMEEMTYPFSVKTLQLSTGEKVAYADEGKGKQTLLFIHGLGSYLPAWKNNIDELKNHYRCVAIDLPGYGKSSKGNYEGSMRYYAKVLKEVADQLNLPKVTLVGHSMGGQISITAALAYPNWVEKLILIAPAGFETFNKGEREWFRQVMTADGVRLTTVEQIRTNLAYNFYEFPKSAQFMIDDRIAMRSAADFPGYCYIIPESVKGMVNEPVYEFLPNISQQCLVIFGENDNLIPNRYLHGGPTRTVAEAGTSRIRNSQLLMLPKSGHFVMFEKAPEVNQAIRTFVNK
jgi:pimeloyl-ACP methyl ester carboxylesterase